MSAQTRNTAVVGILIAIASGALSLALFGPRNAAFATPAAPHVITLAASSTSNTVTVVGSGSATAVPDQGTLSLGVAATRPSVRDAVSQATTDMNRLLGALHGQGVQDKDIQTSWISIYQQTNCCPQIVNGYTSSNQVTVTIHHLANATGVIEASIDSVGNDLQLNGISFSVADTGSIMKSARSSAMNDANVRAQDWARLAGHHVGGLIGLSEVVTAQSLPFEGGKGGAGIPIQAGQTGVTITVTAIYELLA
ncbi:MAG: SIMPL domain-containing protein [Candidatus Dormibacteraeota bacterium]|nr:SIMPL domain-containing protein [Candidatus Dormibacteraeota bacterium]